MNKLLTGGAGYIGSHIIIELDKAGHSVVVVDNLANNLSDVIGAHQSGMIAESPIGIPNNLMPYITQTTQASGKIWVGKHNTVLKKCVVITGIGRKEFKQVLKNYG